MPSGVVGFLMHLNSSVGAWAQCEGNYLFCYDSSTIDRAFGIKTRDWFVNGVHGLLMKDNVFYTGTSEPNYLIGTDLPGSERVLFDGNKRLTSSYGRETQPWPDAQANEHLELGGVTVGTKALRRTLANNSYQSKIALNSGWATEQQWTSGQTVSAGAVRYSGTEVYMTDLGGTCGGTAPTGTSGTSAVSDGTVLWKRIAPKVVWGDADPIGVIPVTP